MADEGVAEVAETFASQKGVELDHDPASVTSDAARAGSTALS